MTTTALAPKGASTANALAEQIRLADQEAIEQARQIEEQVRFTRELVESRERRAEEAELRVEDIEDAWSAGKDDITALDHAEAVSEVTRSAALVSSAKATLSALERKLSASQEVDTILATIIKPLVELALPGVPVHVALSDVQPPPTGNALPVAVVRPRGRTELDERLGFVSGDVQLDYIHGEMHKNLSVEALESATEALGFDVRVVLGGVSSTRDRALLTVRHAWATLPVIAKIQPLEVKKVTSALVISLARLSASGSAVKWTDTLGQQNDYLRIEPGVAHVDAEKVAEGVRTVTIKSTLSIKLKSSLVTGLPSIVADSADELVGRFFAGVGICTSATAAPGGYGGEWVITQSFESAVGSGIVTARQATI